jgi:hypothetical protein
MLLRGEVSVEHAKGQLFVVRSQQPAAWDVKLHQILQKDTTVGGQVEGQPEGVMFTSTIDFEWRQAITTEREAQAKRLVQREEYEQSIVGKKIYMNGNFRLTDDSDKLAAVISEVGGRCEELTAGLWSSAAVEKVEIAATGKGGAKKVGAFVVMQSKAEAELLIQLIQREKKLVWGGQVVSAFICRQWKKKETRASPPKAAHSEANKPLRSSASRLSAPRQVSSGASPRRAPDNVQDEKHYPRLPPTTRWGAAKSTHLPPEAEARLTAATAATAQTTTTASAVPTDLSSFDAMRHTLAETIAALRREGEEDRRRVAELAAQTETQLLGVMENMRQLAQELKEHQRSNAVWQEKATQQIQDLTRAVAAQNEMFLAEFRALRQMPRADGIEAEPADKGSSKKRKAKTLSTAATAAAGTQHSGNTFAPLDEGDDDDARDMEEDDGRLNDGQPIEGEALTGSHGAVRAGSLRPGLSEQQHQQVVHQQGRVLDSHHPQPPRQVEGGGN